MRKLGLSLALLAGAAAPVAAQQMWQPEIGIRGGYTHLDVGDPSTSINLIDLPFSGGFSGALAPTSLYGIIPMGGRFALQPTFGLQHITLAANSGSGQSILFVSAGVRLNAAIANGFYAAVGANGYLIHLSGAEDTQGAVEGALGYRRSIGGRLMGSAEAFYEKREKSELVSVAKGYGVRLGFGYDLGGGTATRGRTGRPTMANNRMWTPSIALQGGWSFASLPDNTDVSRFSLPFTGSALVGGLYIPGPSSVSAIIPFGERWAFEPSFDFHQLKVEGTDPFTALQLGLRANYAFGRSLYAGAGVDLSKFGQSGLDTKFRASPLVAVGARFPLMAGISGRTEFNYKLTSAGGADDAFGDGQVTSFLFGIMVPVK